MSQRAISGDYSYFVTFNVHHRRWFFVGPELAAALGQAIVTCCRIKHFDLLAYCILPNHVHLLVRKLPADEVGASSLPVITSPFSQRTLERVRCTPRDVNAYLFSHRRLSSPSVSSSPFEALRPSGPNGRPRGRRAVDRRERFTLSDLMKSIKGSYSRTLPKGKFWQHRSHFLIVEDESTLPTIINYIRYNYRKMNLPEWYGQASFVYVDAVAVRRTLGAKDDMLST